MMGLDLPPREYLSRDAMFEVLTRALTQGYLTLYVGAGVSASVNESSESGGFPQWGRLVEVCCSEAGVLFQEDRAGLNAYLRERMERVEEKFGGGQEYVELIKDHLYDGVVFDVGLMKTDLLVALGSLVMGSVRGSTNAVINYNFDDLIEWYLDYHGFRTQAVSRMPSLGRKCDVNVYHPHGFLPANAKYDSQKTSTVVFSQRTYDEAIREPGTPWNSLQRNFLGQNVGLFLGMSGQDPHVDILYGHVYAQLAGERIVGFITLERNKDNLDKQDHLLARGIVPLYLEAHSELPGLLLEICRRSASLE